ncbi:N-6 DNA methylase [Roseateles chitinivorans]|uniref:type I restriction-modification system subunit M/S n=1 Tax=Roseateles chitinivorans TaxID=2917965 RepID=UPI003D6698C6
MFALVWLAAGRMVADLAVHSATRQIDLADLAGWKVLASQGFPQTAVELAMSPSTDGQHRAERAAAIVSHVIEEAKLGPWDVLPCLMDPTGGHADIGGTVVPELASLALDLLGAPANSEVWIPFDLRGQLTVQALRRGLRVLAWSPLPTWPLVRQLMWTIETGSPQPEAVQFDLGSFSTKPSGLRADYALVLPPPGMQMKDQRLAPWVTTDRSNNEQFPRSESWAIHEFADRADKRAVFLTPQGVLFAKGHDQRLREYLLYRGRERNEVDAVVALPAGVFQGTTVAAAMLLMDFEHCADSVYMADLGKARRSLLEAGQAVADGHRSVLERAEGDRSRRVTRDEIAANEYSFAPSRYLRKVKDLDEVAVTLDEICEVIRPPAITKESTPFEVAEVGLPELRLWQPISGELDKSVLLKAAPKESVHVREGDIILCVKGSVGRVGLMGDAATHRPTVVSQSCVALRLKQGKATISPEVLFMYLRSPHGQEQLLGLQVGTGVQHISPGTLLSAVSVPLPSYETALGIRRDFCELRDLEHRVSALEHRMKEIVWQRWPIEAL